MGAVLSISERDEKQESEANGTKSKPELQRATVVELPAAEGVEQAPSSKEAAVDLRDQYDELAHGSKWPSSSHRWQADHLSPRTAPVR